MIRHDRLRAFSIQLGGMPRVNTVGVLRDAFVIPEIERRQISYLK
jgi:hypothetical protein